MAIAELSPRQQLIHDAGLTATAMVDARFTSEADLGVVATNILDAVRLVGGLQANLVAIEEARLAGRRTGSSPTEERDLRLSQQTMMKDLFDQDRVSRFDPYGYFGPTLTYLPDETVRTVRIAYEHPGTQEEAHVDIPFTRFADEYRHYEHIARLLTAAEGQPSQPIRADFVRVDGHHRPRN